MPKYNKRGSYYTNPRPPGKKTEERIVVPQVEKRPVRFQTRSLIREELIQRDPYWLVIHRRGISRPQIGENPLEARAIPHNQLRGTLPERIIYKSLLQEFHLIPGVDFIFQSSLQRGRIDTGGIVADFLFPYLMIVINPTGPTHSEYIRIWKDNEQPMALAEMGYEQYFIPEDNVYDEYYLSNWLRKILGWMHHGGSMSPNDQADIETSPGFQADKIMTALMDVSDYIHTGVY